MRWDDICNECEVLAQEVQLAGEEHGAFRSAHEGLAVLLEEFEELKAEVWKKRAERDMLMMRQEARHVACVALKFVMEVCKE